MRLLVSLGWPLTIRSSRPRVVASATCFALRLHVSAAPPQAGLTQALGGRKAFDCFAFQHGDIAGFDGVALRSVSRCVTASVKSVGRAQTFHALRWPASETVIDVLSFPEVDTVALVTSG